MTVRDERSARRQVRGDGRLHGRVGDGPQPVRHSVVGDGTGQRRLAVYREIRRRQREYRDTDVG